MNNHIPDPQGYLSRLSASLQAKLAAVAGFIPAEAKTILDVGCADGQLTIALSSLFPQAIVVGLDIRPDFIDRAIDKMLAAELRAPRLRFQNRYLRDMLVSSLRFDTIIFSSVLHEIWTYAQGTTSVLKALADATELLAPGGRIIIRDMIPPASSLILQPNPRLILQMVNRFPLELRDFVRAHGPINSLRDANHFLLKYFYTENWKHECSENYMPLPVETYQRIGSLCELERVHQSTGLLPWLEAKWKQDFQLGPEELNGLISTTILVFQAKK